MNKNILIGIVGGGVLVIAGTYYALSIRGTSVQQAAQTQTSTITENSEAQPEKFNGSLTQLASRTGSWKCTIDTAVAPASVSGTTYVAHGKVRGDFIATIKGYGDISTHMLFDDEYVYTWSSAMPQGMKMKMNLSSATGTTSAQMMSTNQAYAYGCSPWTSDDALFVLPANIVFKLIST